jgi:integrase
MAALANELLADQIIPTLPWRTRSQFKVREGAMPIRSIDAETFALFRNVGLLGYLPDKSYDATFPSTTRLRDGLFADLLVSDGLRRVEAASLLITDLPPVDLSRPRDRGWLPAPITKGQKGRNYVVLRRWREKLRLYHESEWQTQHHYAQATFKRNVGSLNLATDYDSARRSLMVDGKWKRIDAMDRDFRSALLVTADVAKELGLPAEDDWLVSLAVFPGTRAPSVGVAGWTQTFAEANLRVQRLTAEYGMEPPVRVTPHMLRHTFAIHFLRDALRVMDERQKKAVADQDLARLEKYLLNPLTELKDLLGHSSMDTTLMYLREAVHQDRWYDSTFSNLGDAFLSMVDEEDGAA